jgi:Na+/proline symporter
VSFAGWAIAALGLSTLVFAAVGIYATHRGLSLETYLTARGTMRTGAAVGTLVASAMGAWILFSPAETATWAGLVAVVGYGLGSVAPLVGFAVIGPRLRAVMPEGHALTEYVWHRFGAPMYGLTLVIMVFYMFIYLAAELTAMALAAHLLAGTPLGLTAAVVGVATVVYTAWGGLPASILTDRLQYWVMLPLVALVVVAMFVMAGGTGAVGAAVSGRAPQLLAPGFLPGIKFGTVLIIAILAANMFHQGFWQRVFACRDDRVVRSAFSWSGVPVFLMVVGTGSLGLVAVSLGTVDPPSTALFAAARQLLPAWGLLALLVLAVALCMSSVDTLLNGLASLVTVDLGRLLGPASAGRLLGLSRLATVLFVLPAIAIAMQGLSVLYLFLIADLLCSAALVPVFAGLYAARLPGTAALVSTLLGLLVGALWFPWRFPEPGGDFLVSFGGALVTSALATLVLARAGRPFDFGRLRVAVKPLPEGAGRPGAVRRRVID